MKDKARCSIGNPYIKACSSAATIVHSFLGFDASARVALPAQGVPFEDEVTTPIACPLRRPRRGSRHPRHQELRSRACAPRGASPASRLRGDQAPLAQISMSGRARMHLFAGKPARCAPARRDGAAGGRPGLRARVAEDVRDPQRHGEPMDAAAAASLRSTPTGAEFTDAISGWTTTLQVVDVACRRCSGPLPGREVHLGALDLHVGIIEQQQRPVRAPRSSRREIVPAPRPPRSRPP